MALSRDIETIRRTELFSGFSVDQLRLIAFTVTRLSCETGQMLFEEDAESLGAYLVESGTLTLEAGGRSAGIAGAGSLLAEAALISSVPHRVRAIAAEPADILLIRRDQFLRLIEEYPDIASEMDRRLRRNFAEMVSALSAVKTRLSDF
ncbi:Crp/Fnr family transcriptional regulator [Martelella lutilitoris]|uniref:Crp/Fnr family transcriptional regulator n=1 Tax=Martelella lutilitoris TaxID=2583532 RepID=A0A5C4JU42_9HYPH|nr:Crp/Fnr family transcriptional regulator [Martelella lutilitoris]TNB48787.1 Crp/Fnr family transcriptional regulator [Martelella lutilitoris]